MNLRSRSKEVRAVDKIDTYTRDPESNRSVRAATIETDDPHRQLLPPLLDANFGSGETCQVDMTGRKRSQEGI
jgi:hypothetical protein